MGADSLPLGFRRPSFRRTGAGIAEILAGLGLTASNGQLTASIATWDASVCRYYMLDYDGGSDANTGYIDAAAGTTFSAGQLVGIPFKTIEKLLQVLPRFGNGRSLVILVKLRAGGATYRNIANSADDTLDLTGVGGYGYVSVRGSNDLTNSSADQVSLGQIQGQAGPGGSGEWTVAAGATTTTIPVAAGALTAEPGLIGMRVRFDPATTTAALRNTSAMILANTGTVITTSSALAAVPAAGDIFYVERPGVRVGSFLAPDAGIPGRLGAIAPVVVAGIAVTGTVAGNFALRSPGLVQAAFIEATGSTTQPVVVDGASANFITIQQQYPNESGAFVSAGVGLRAACGVNLVLGTGTRFVLRSAFLHATAGISLGGLSGQWTGYAQAGLSVATVGDSGALFSIGSTTAGIPRSRILSGTVRVAGRATLRALDITNAAAAAITIGSSAADNITRTAVVNIDDVVGSTGNTGVGIDASNAIGSYIYFGRTVANTVTGTTGDIKLAGGALTAHTTFTKTGFVDNAFNTLVGTAGQVSGEATLVTNQSGGALAVGDILRTNGTSGQVTKAQADTAAHATGVCGVSVTTPANAAVGYMVGPGGTPYVRFSAAPAAGGLYYLDQANAGQATTTVPPVAATNQKLRLGYHVTTLSGNDSAATFTPELFPVVSNGAAP